MLKRAITGVLMLCVCLTCFTFAANADGNTADIQFGENEFTKCAENSLYELYVIGAGERTGEFYVKNKLENTDFYSNPQNRDMSAEALKETEKENSQFLISIYNEEGGAVRTISSFKGSGNGKYIEISAAEDGFNAAYKINNAIKISLKVRIKASGISVESNISKINRIKGNVITNIQLLPYFGASAYGEDGYMLVPDGSGALIYNNTAKQNADCYLQKIYGEDIAFAKSVKAVVTKQVYLPVFGVKNKNGGFIAAVDAGTENANIIAESASNEFMYNRAYCTFDVAGADKISIGEGVSELSSSTETYDKKNQLTDKFTVSYMFVSKSADYSEMADVYRNHIGLKKGNVSNTPSVFLELYGGLNRKESVFGIPLTVFKKMTTVKQAEEIVSYFETETGGNPVVIYRNADSAVISGKIQNKFRFKGALGSKKQLESLKEKCRGNLFLENNIFSAVKGGNGFSTFSDTVWRINRNNVMAYAYNPASTLKDKSKPSAYAVKSSELNKIYTKYFNSLKKAGFDSAFVNLSNTTYSDFDTDGYISRASTANTFNSLIKKHGKNGLLYAPNAYAFGNGKYISDSPTASSNYDIIDEDIPFYQLVMAGVKEYSTESINLNSNTDTAFLKALESGSSLKFTFVYDNITSIKNTEYDYLYGADFNNRKEQAADYQKRIEEAYAALGSRVLKASRVLQNGVHLSEFDNGSRLIVNFTEADVKTEYGEVRAGGYITVKK